MTSLQQKLCSAKRGAYSESVYVDISVQVNNFSFDIKFGLFVEA